MDPVWNLGLAFRGLGLWGCLGIWGGGGGGGGGGGFGPGFREADLSDVGF